MLELSSAIIESALQAVIESGLAAAVGGVPVSVVLLPLQASINTNTAIALSIIDFLKFMFCFLYL